MGFDLICEVDDPPGHGSHHRPGAWFATTTSSTREPSTLAEGSDASTIETAAVRSVPSCLGEEFEAVYAAGAHDREVSPVEGCRLGDIETFGGGDDRCIDRSERQVWILAHQFGDAQPIGCRHGFDAEFTRGQVTQETGFSMCAETTSDEVDHLGDHQGRDDQGTEMRQEEIKGLVVVPVVGVNVSIKRPGIDQDRYLATSAVRSSSIRSAMSSRPLRPAPAARSRRSRPPR